MLNNNLMQQIQSLFSDWFVTFTPFGGNKPSSWNKTDIYAISKVIYGAPFASKAFNTERNGVPIIRIRDLKEQQFVTYTTETHPKGYLTIRLGLINECVFLRISVRTVRHSFIV